MTKKKITSKPKRNVQYPSDIKDKVEDIKVAPEIIADQQEIIQTSVKEQSYKPSTEHLKPYQFKPGHTGNPKGRSIDPVKAIGKRIAGMKVIKSLKPKQLKLAEEMGFDLKEITMLENLMLELATSSNPMKVALYLERTFGKVPNINLNAEISTGLVTRFKSKLTDSELEAIANGADAMDILFDKLPDIEEDNVIDVDAT